MGTADDMRILLELGRTGRVAEAAKRLGINHTTVSRKITRLEKHTGTRLFNRGQAGWQLTEAGRRLLPFAETIETAIHAATLDEAAPRAGLTGTVRVLAPDGFGSFLLVPGLVPGLMPRPAATPRAAAAPGAPPRTVCAVAAPSPSSPFREGSWNQ